MAIGADKRSYVRRDTEATLTAAGYLNLWIVEGKWCAVTTMEVSPSTDLGILGLGPFDSLERR